MGQSVGTSGSRRLMGRNALHSTTSSSWPDEQLGLSVESQQLSMTREPVESGEKSLRSSSSSALSICLPLSLSFSLSLSVGSGVQWQGRLATGAAEFSGGTTCDNVLFSTSPRRLEVDTTGTKPWEGRSSAGACRTSKPGALQAAAGLWSFSPRGRQAMAS
eukprot:scaffold436_cov267-Pinguiococcus_pyrenoidosus.AAC.19